MSEHTSNERTRNDCEALNAFAGRRLETVDDLAEFAEERGMEPHEVLAAARRHYDLQVDITVGTETTEQVSCLVVPDGSDRGDVRLTTFDVFQEGEQVHATRLIITDTDGHDAWLDLAPAQVQQVGEWLVREGQRLQSAGRERVSA